MTKPMQEAEIAKALSGMESGTFKISRKELLDRHTLSEHAAGKLALQFKQDNKFTGPQLPILRPGRARAQEIGIRPASIPRPYKMGRAETAPEGI